MDASWATIGLVISAAVVFLGVVLEGWEHLDEIRAKGWRPIVPKIGFAILVIGLASEIYFEKVAADMETGFRNRAMADLSTSAVKLRKESQKARLEEDKLSANSLMLGNIFLPRRVAVSLGPNGPSGENFATLLKFRGTKVIVLSVPDLEAVQLAADIAGALQGAKWNVEQVSVLSFAQAYSVVGLHLSIQPKSNRQRTEKYRNSKMRL